MAKPLPLAKIRRAAALYCEGEPLAGIARRLKVGLTTVKAWAKTSAWQAELARLRNLEQEAAATAALKYKESYTAQLLRSREILRETADQQVQVAAALSAAANAAIKAISENNGPIAAVEALAKGGPCYAASTSALVARAAKDLLNQVYAINRVLDFIESQR